MSERSIRREHQRQVEASERRDGLRTRRAGLAAATVGAFALAGPASASASNFVVTNLNDGPAVPANCTVTSCDLRDAVAAANANTSDDTITFQSGLSGTIRLTSGEIPIYDSNALAIYGPGSGVISVSGDADNSGTPNAGDSRVFNVKHPGSGTPQPVTISGLTMTQGYSGSSGGAVYGSFNTRVTLADDAITNSTAGAGGGVYSRSASMTISDTTISGNQATSGRAGGVYASGHVTVSDSTISGNTASTYGGGLYSSTKYGMTVSDAVISGNSAPTGGGVYFANSSKYRSSITGTTISQNNASNYGAGIAIGGISSNGRLTISHSTIARNTGGSGSNGGGIGFNYAVNGEFFLSDSTVSGNTASVGGGVSLGNGNKNRLVGPNGVLEFDNSTIASNTATTKGGGLYLGEYSTSGGPPPYTSATIPLRSTIVANNSAVGSAQDLSRNASSTGGAFALSFSLVRTPGTAPVTQSGPNLIGADPQLGPLADNGGLTQTMLPALTSPVVDQGHAPGNLATDQRGASRTVDVPAPNPPGGDGTDIGAVELQSGLPITLVAKKRFKTLRTHKKRKRVKVEFSSDQPGATFECSVDNGPYQPCTSPFRTKLSSKHGKGALHTISIRAKNAGGVEQQPVTITFRVIRLG